jgi:endonuclease YncB( thermonuclease family)
MPTKSDPAEAQKDHMASYRKLIKELTEILSVADKTGSQALNQSKIEAYWLSGKRLTQTRSTHKVTLTQMAKDLGIMRMKLYRTLNFYETWQQGLSPNAKRLPWGHHILLLGLKTAKVRDYYVTTALTRGLNRPALQRALKRGDHETLPENSPDSMLMRDADPLFVYKAIIEKIVDGDTLDVKLDLGFNTWSTQRIRLRGINAAEIAKPNSPVTKDANLAKRAKAYLVKKLSTVEFVVIKTYKTDIYGRFVADVFYHPTLENRHDVARKGLFLNEELLKVGLALPSLV